MDLQLVLVFILALLTVNLLIVGVYAVLVLRDLRVTLEKANSALDSANSILETTDTVTTALSSPVTAISSIANAIVGGVAAAKSISTIAGSRGDE